MNYSHRLSCPLVLLAMLLLPLSSLAEHSSSSWQLVGSDSSLQFISVKKSSIAEIHSFKTLTGTVDASGKVSVSVALDSVATLIPIRDERMREFLFETRQYPTATVRAEVDIARISALDAGERLVQSLPLTLSLHGKEKTLSSQLDMVRLIDGRVQVTTRTPLLIRAGDFDLLAGIDQLKALANLPSIATAVPITVTLLFEPSEVVHE